MDLLIIILLIVLLFRDNVNCQSRGIMMSRNIRPYDTRILPARKDSNVEEISKTTRS